MFKFREVRTKVGLTQEEAARKIGRDKRWLSNVELGKVRIFYEDAVKLSAVYGGTPDIFLPTESILNRLINPEGA